MTAPATHRSWASHQYRPQDDSYEARFGNADGSDDTSAGGGSYPVRIVDGGGESWTEGWHVQRPLRTLPRVYIIGEDHKRMQVLLEALDARRVPVTVWNTERGALIPTAAPPPGVFFCRQSPSAGCRHHATSITYAKEIVGWLELWGATVLNGSRALAVETSKALQLGIMHAVGLNVPHTVVCTGGGQLAVEAARWPAPVLVKPNLGGSGSGIASFATGEDAARHVKYNPQWTHGEVVIPKGVNGGGGGGGPAGGGAHVPFISATTAAAGSDAVPSATPTDLWLLQEHLGQYTTSPDAMRSVLRIEVIDGKVQRDCIVKVTAPVKVFGLCPCDPRAAQVLSRIDIKMLRDPLRIPGFMSDRDGGAFGNDQKGSHGNSLAAAAARFDAFCDKVEAAFRAAGSVVGSVEGFVVWRRGQHHGRFLSSNAAYDDGDDGENGEDGEDGGDGDGGNNDTDVDGDEDFSVTPAAIANVRVPHEPVMFDFNACNTNYNVMAEKVAGVTPCIDRVADMLCRYYAATLQCTLDDADDPEGHVNLGSSAASGDDTGDGENFDRVQVESGVDDDDRDNANAFDTSDEDEHLKHADDAGINAGNEHDISDTSGYDDDGGDDGDEEGESELEAEACGGDNTSNGVSVLEFNGVSETDSVSDCETDADAVETNVVTNCMMSNDSNGSDAFLSHEIVTAGGTGTCHHDVLQSNDDNDDTSDDSHTDADESDDGNASASSPREAGESSW